MNPISIVFRRIIYSIPLKILLVLLAVFSVLFACFSNAYEYIEPNFQNINTNNRRYQIENPNNDNICVINTYSSSNEAYIAVFEVYGDTSSNLITYFNYLQIYCSTDSYINLRNNYGPSPIAILYYVDNNYTSMQCQTEYNLIPISSVDQNYCTSNNLCPASGPSDCPNVGVSNLYINDIFHPGAFNVIMNIPEEIDWDYAYTNSGFNINIDVVGYNQDFEQIEGWIETNNYKPTSEDFTNIFTNFSNFGGLLIATLFVILVFYFVKKMFK